MIRTVTALFDDTDEAEAAFDVLSRRLAILKGAIVTCGPGEKPDFGAIYLSRAQREACEAELAEGGSLVIVQVEGDRAAEQAVDLLDRHAQGPSAAPEEDVRTSPAPEPAPIAAAPPPAQPALRPISRPPAGSGNVEGMPISTLSRRAAPAPAQPEPEPATASAPAPVAAEPPEPVPEPAVQSEEHIPLPEEELRIGKRSLVRGGARVHSYMEEVPVTTEVELLEEQTSIERRPVNRRLTEEEIQASGLLQDRVVEVTQMREEAVVTKEAVVREELVVKKTIEKRIEQINETVRRTAVEMERLEPEMAGGGDSPRRG